MPVTVEQAKKELRRRDAARELESRGVALEPEAAPDPQYDDIVGPFEQRERVYSFLRGDESIASEFSRTMVMPSKTDPYGVRDSDLGPLYRGLIKEYEDKMINSMALDHQLGVTPDKNDWGSAKIILDNYNNVMQENFGEIGITPQKAREYLKQQFDPANKKRPAPEKPWYNEYFLSIEDWKTVFEALKKGDPYPEQEEPGAIEALKWLTTYTASLGGRLGPKGLREELLDAAKDYKGFGPAVGPAVGDALETYFTWIILYPKLFKAAGITGKSAAKLPIVQKAAKSIKSVPGLDVFITKHPKVVALAKRVAAAFTKGEVVGATTAAIELAGKEESIGTWVSKMNKRGLMMGGVSLIFSAAHSYDQYRYIKNTRRYLYKTAYARHTKRVKEGMPEKTSRSLAESEGDKIKDIIYYMESEFYGETTELYGGKKPALSPEQAARNFAKHGFDIQHGGKTYKQLREIRRDRLRDVLLHPEPKPKASKVAERTTAYQEIIQTSTGKRVGIAPQGTTAKQLKPGYKLSEPIPFDKSGVIRAAEETGIVKTKGAADYAKKVKKLIIPWSEMRAKLAAEEAEMVEGPEKTKLQLQLDEMDAQAADHLASIAQEGIKEEGLATEITEDTEKKQPWELSETNKQADDMGFTKTDQRLFYLLERGGTQVNISGVPMSEWFDHKTPDGLLFQTDRDVADIQKVRKMAESQVEPTITHTEPEIIAPMEAGEDKGLYRVYHGSQSKFEKYEYGKEEVSTSSYYWPEVAWFSDSPKAAGTYGPRTTGDIKADNIEDKIENASNKEEKEILQKELREHYDRRRKDPSYVKGYVYEANIELKNPLVYDAEGKGWTEISPLVTRAALSKNLKEAEESIDEYIDIYISRENAKGSLPKPLKSKREFLNEQKSKILDLWSGEHDGVIIKNVYDSGSVTEQFANKQTVYGVFEKKGKIIKFKELTTTESGAKESEILDLKSQIAAREAGETDEQLSGITKKRRRSLIKETAAKIKAHDIYQTEVAAAETRVREVGPGFYYVHESGRGEVEAALESVPKGRIRNKIKKMFTFERDDLQAKGGSAIAWDVAVQEGLLTEFEEQGEMDLSQFVRRVADSVAEGVELGGLNVAALRGFEQSEYPDAVMLAEKYRMLRQGSSDIEINEMITEWAERNDIPVEAIMDEFVNADKMLEIAEMPEAEQEAEIERLATEQILAEDQIAAMNAYNDILEKQGLKPEAKIVEEIEFEDDVPFERRLRGRPTAALVSEGGRQIAYFAMGSDRYSGFHEALHDFIITGKIIPADVKMLHKNYGPGLAGEEAAADAFGVYAATNEAPNSAIRKIFEKIKRILEKIKSALAGKGIRTPADLFGEIVAGKLQKIATKGTEGTRFERRETPVWYSKLQRAVEAKMPNKMDSAAFRNWANKQGIKKEEMLWSGVDELLTKKTTVTKKDVLDTIAINNVQIDEVVKGGKAAEKQGRDSHQIETDMYNIIYKIDDITEEIEKNIKGLPVDIKIKYGVNGDLARNQLVRKATYPGSVTTGEHKDSIKTIEKLLPDYDINNLTDLLDEQEELRNEANVIRSEQEFGGEATLFSQYKLAGGENYREVLLRLPEAEPSFTESHWRESNVLAHFRIDDRTDKTGAKVLFIEEIQSDWHQKGRAKGYKSEEDKQKITELQSKIDAIRNDPEYQKIDYNLATSEMTNRQKTLRDELNQTIGKLQSFQYAIPDAPFKTTWHELAFKRILRYAAEEGYNKVAWTTGEQQAERYDLSKYVEIITAAKGKAGVSITATTKEGRNVIDSKLVQENELDAIVGKDLADKIRVQKEEFHSYMGLELKVGGLGMKGFYDKILPAFVKKYMKKWGVKEVGETKIDVGPRKELLEQGVSAPEELEAVHSIPVTESMKESVLGGQVMYETSGQRLRREAEQRAMINARKERIRATLPKKKKVSRARLKIKIREETPALTPELSEALLPIGKPIMFREPKYRRTQPVSDKPVPQSEVELNRQRHRITRAREKVKHALGGIHAGEKTWFEGLDDRLKRLHPELKRILRDMEELSITRTAEDMNYLETFFKKLDKMALWHKDDYADWDIYIKNGDREGYMKIMAKHGIIEENSKWREVDEVIFEAFNTVGREVDHRKNHYPRRVIAGKAKEFREYLVEHYGKSVILPVLDAAISKREEQAQRKLTDGEKARVIDSTIRGFGGQHIWLSKPGIIKERSVLQVTAEMNRLFYVDSRAAMKMYIQDAHASIAAAEFFGKETQQIQRLRKTKSSLLTSLGKASKRQSGPRPWTEEKHKEHISKRRAKLDEINNTLEQLVHHDVKESIGQLLVEGVRLGWVKENQQDEIHDMLHSYFQPGRMHSFWGNVKSATYMVHIGQYLSALVNLKDYGRIIYRTKLDAIPASVIAMTPGLRVMYSMKEVGLTEAGIDIGTTNKMLNFVLAANFFKKFDVFMRDVASEALLINYRRQAGRKSNMRPDSAFMERLSSVFRPDDLKLVIQDLKSKERVKTPRLKKLIFNEIADMHPVTRSALTEAHLRGRSGAKLIYTMRQFSLKEVGQVRNEVFNDIDKHPARNISRLFWMMACMTLAGASVEKLKALIRGKELTWGDAVINAFLNIILLSRYGINMFKSKGLAEGAFDQMHPPTAIVDRPTRDLFRSIGKGEVDLKETPRNIPLVGELYYDQIRENKGGGKRIR